MRRQAFDIEDAEELLLGTCDDLGRHVGVTKIYNPVLQWVELTSLRLLTASIPCAIAALAVVVFSEPSAREPGPWLFLSTFGVALAFALVAMFFQTPQRIQRQADCFVVETPLASHRVPVDDILELVILNNGHKLGRLKRRWEMFPHGWKRLSVFSGATPKYGHVCVLLTRKIFWSFAFVIEDPVQFLLDNQKPLDQKAVYRTTGKAALRAEEALDSAKVGAVPKGRLLQVEEQRGRRILVRVDNVEEPAWMSYISSKGRCLLTKERREPGGSVVGASELSRGCDVEMPLALDHVDAIE